MSASAAGRHFPQNERLLEAARAGDAAAFGRLAEEYRPYLKTVANRVLAGRLPGDGSDIVQTGLALAFENLAQLRQAEPAAFLGWLVAIVRNEGLRALCQVGQLQALPDGFAADHVAAASNGPDARASRREQAARLLAAIQRLPEDYRRVIELRNLQELPFEKVAQRMGRSSAAVRKLWTPAVDRLRQELGDES
jgi:RNA polymerase sigma-70 factor (ECF subfamily)